MDLFFGVLLLGSVLFGAIKVTTKQENNKDIEKLPASVENLFNRMDKANQNLFKDEYDRRRKFLLTSYLFWLIGFHYLYNKKVGLQVFYLITLGGFVVWVIIDFFRMPRIVNATNGEIGREIVNTLALGNTFKTTD
jgi:hypothetical protein